MVNGVAGAVVDGTIWAPRIVLVVAVTGYWVVFSLARRMMIARPHREAVHAELRNLCTEIRLGELATEKQAALVGLLGVDEKPTSVTQRAKFARSWLWNGELELAASMRLAAVRQLLPDTYPDAEVRARLGFFAVSDRMTLSTEQLQAVEKVLAEGETDLARRRRHALLRELEGSAVRESLSDYRDMLNLHRKSWWLTVVALSAVLVLGSTEERLLVPLLAGAIGGFLATVFRFTRSKGVPTQYQTAWAVITLAVPVGALGGAVAAVLIAGLHDLGFVGREFGGFTAYLQTGRNSQVWTVATVAFVAGFSARFIERLAERLDKSVNTPPPGSPGHPMGHSQQPPTPAVEAPRTLSPSPFAPQVDPQASKSAPGNGSRHDTAGSSPAQH